MKDFSDEFKLVINEAYLQGMEDLFYMIKKTQNKLDIPNLNNCEIRRLITITKRNIKKLEKGKKLC